MKTIPEIQKIDFRHIPKTYSQLVRMFPPRPLHDETDLANATEIVDAMAGHDLNHDQEDYLDLLSDLVRKYEETRHPMPSSAFTPLERLKFVMDESGMTASDLGRLLGSRGLGSSIVRGRRQLSKRHIRTLADWFKLDAGYFL